MKKESVLIVGGAGSIGKEFVRLLHKDYKVTVVDSSEWAMAELAHEFPDVELVIDDYASDNYLKIYNYAIVLAAYKHVNLAETNIKSCIDNNLTKLVKFYSEAICNRVLYFSTDKAVEPVSVYGATKMIAERLTWSLGGSVARCGNFLGSSGSVIPVWEKCITEGKPIPITDERMVRYVHEDMFETVTEVWNQFMDGKKLIVPKSKPLRLMDLLSEVLKKHKYMMASAYIPGIQIVGIRAGEKIEEKLKWEEEE